MKLLLIGLAWMVLVKCWFRLGCTTVGRGCMLAICATRHALPYLARTGSLPYQLHSRLDGWNAAAPGSQKLLPQQVRHT